MSTLVTGCASFSSYQKGPSATGPFLTLAHLLQILTNSERRCVKAICRYPLGKAPRSRGPKPFLSRPCPGSCWCTVRQPQATSSSPCIISVLSSPDVTTVTQHGHYDSLAVDLSTSIAHQYYIVTWWTERVKNASTSAGYEFVSNRWYGDSIPTIDSVPLDADGREFESS